MSITGSLETFSLPELFRLIDAGSKSGQLTIHSSAGAGSYSMWFHNGRFIAVGDRVGQLGLINSIERRGWAKKRDLQQFAQSCPHSTPLGIHLKNQSVLQAEQLKRLFQDQLLQVHQLFELGAGRFELNEVKRQGATGRSLRARQSNGQRELPKLQPVNNTSFPSVAQDPHSGAGRGEQLNVPWLEMTGLSLRAIEVALLALRRLKNWNSYTDQLPQGSSALEALVSRPSLSLKALELQLWVLADGKTSLETMTRQVNRSLSEVQQAAFRLMVAGLVEEVPLSQQSIKLVPARPRSLAPVAAPPAKTKAAVSSSLLQNLIQFLRGWF